jgi:hypothetical protein
MHNDVDEGEQHISISDTKLQPNILSRIRNFNSLAMNSIGSLFSASSSSQEGFTNFDSADYAYDLCDNTHYAEDAPALEENNRFRVQDCYDLRTLTAEAPTPTQTRSSTPVRSNRLQGVKRIFTSFSRSRQTNSSGRIHSGQPDDSQTPPPPPPPTTSSIASVSVFSGSDHLVTPPLTPDMIDDHILLSPLSSSYSQDIPYDPYRFAGHCIASDQDRDNPYAQTNSLEVKEGKKPERVIVRSSIPCLYLLTLELTMAVLRYPH